jgi:hypothetical protein
VCREGWNEGGGEGAASKEPRWGGMEAQTVIIKHIAVVSRNIYLFHSDLRHHAPPPPPTSDNKAHRCGVKEHLFIPFKFTPPRPPSPPHLPPPTSEILSTPQLHHQATKLSTSTTPFPSSSSAPSASAISSLSQSAPSAFIRASKSSLLISPLPASSS